MVKNPLEVRSHFHVTSRLEVRTSTDVGVKWFLVNFSKNDGPTRRGEHAGSLSYLVAGAEDRLQIATLALSQ